MSTSPLLLSWPPLWPMASSFRSTGSTQPQVVQGMYFPKQCATTMGFQRYPVHDAPCTTPRARSVLEMLLPPPACVHVLRLALLRVANTADVYVPVLRDFGLWDGPMGWLQDSGLRSQRNAFRGAADGARASVPCAFSLSCCTQQVSSLWALRWSWNALDRGLGGLWAVILQAATLFPNCLRSPRCCTLENGNGLLRELISLQSIRIIRSSQYQVIEFVENKGESRPSARGPLPLGPWALSLFCRSRQPWHSQNSAPRGSGALSLMCIQATLCQRNRNLIASRRCSSRILHAGWARRSFSRVSQDLLFQHAFIDQTSLT